MFDLLAQVTDDPAKAAAAAEAARAVSTQGMAWLGGAIAAGTAAGGGAIGIGVVFSKAVEAAARQPEALPLIQRLMFLGFALCEAQVLYALLIALYLVFTK